MQIDRHKSAVLLILGSSLCFSTMNSLSSHLGQSLPSGEVAFFRVFISLLFLTPFLKYKGIPFFGKRWGLVLVRGSAGFASLTLGFFALTKIPIAEVSVLWKSSVIFTAILSVILLKEKVSLRLVICTLLSFFGAVLILKPSIRVNNIGGVAALSAGFLVAIVSVSIRKLHQTEHSDTIVFGFCFWGSLLGLMFFGHNFVQPTLSEWILLFIMGVSGLFGQIFFTRAFRCAPASVVQPLTFAEVIITSIVGASIFGQIPDALSILGGIAIIVSGIGIVTQNSKQAQI